MAYRKACPHEKYLAFHPFDPGFGSRLGARLCRRPRFYSAAATTAAIDQQFRQFLLVVGVDDRKQQHDD
jgi:hypothetical protein